MTNGSGGGSVGINPDLLQSMINSMKSSSGNALNLVNGYISAFGQYGLDTSSLTKAVQDLNWAQGQLPMLSRRQSMAQAVAEEHPGMTVTPAGAGPLDYATNAQAAAAGKKAGQQALQELTNHESDQEILAELQKSGDDPSYVAAFFQALGPQGLTALGIQVTGYQQGGQKSEYTQWSQAVGQAFGVATFSMPYDKNFLDNLYPPDDIGADPTDPQLSLIAPFLDQGVLSSTWLKPLGQYALNTAYAEGQMPGSMTPVDLDPIWSAIANNPSFAAQYYSQNFTNSQNPRDSLSGLMSNPMTQWVGDSAFASMVKSATVPPGYAAKAGQIGPWAANAQTTVRTFGSSSGVDTSDDIKQAFGEIAMFYFNDMYNTVGAAAPGIGENGKNVPGFNITATSSDWSNFLNEVMSGKTSSAQFLTFYSAWRNQYPDNLSPWQNEQFQLMDNLVVTAYNNNHQPAGSDPSAISDIVAAAGSSFLTSLVFGPEAGVADALLDGVKDGFQTSVEDTITSAFDSDGSGLSDPASPEAIQQITAADSNWERIVRTWYNNEGGKPATGVTIGGKPSSGDPQYYINEFGGAKANFLQDGKIIDLSTIQANPAMLAAYNAWLQSGALAESTIPGFNVPGQPAKTLSSDLPQQASSAGGG